MIVKNETQSKLVLVNDGEVVHLLPGSEKRLPLTEELLKACDDGKLKALTFETKDLLRTLTADNLAELLHPLYVAGGKEVVYDLFVLSQELSLNEETAVIEEFLNGLE